MSDEAPTIEEATEFIKHHELHMGGLEAIILMELANFFSSCNKVEEVFGDKNHGLCRSLEIEMKKMQESFSGYRTILENYVKAGAVVSEEWSDVIDM